MKRQIGLKRSFNCEDLSSIVETGLSIEHPTADNPHRYTENRRHKRIRTLCTSSLINPVSTKLSSPTSVHFISPSASKDRVTITPDSSPSIQSLATSETPTSLILPTEFECPATVALNCSLLNLKSSILTDWDASTFPVGEGKEQCYHEHEAWPSFESGMSSPRSLDLFPELPVRRVTLTSRTCSVRNDVKLESDYEVGKLQTAFSLLSLPPRKLEPRNTHAL
eukprot:scaffold13953_cov58-Cyclotella_meneghiniana.AAC.1